MSIHRKILNETQSKQTFAFEYHNNKPTQSHRANKKANTPLTKQTFHAHMQQKTHSPISRTMASSHCTEFDQPLSKTLIYRLLKPFLLMYGQINLCVLFLVKNVSDNLSVACNNEGVRTRIRPLKMFKIDDRRRSYLFEF